MVPKLTVLISPYVVILLLDNPNAPFTLVVISTLVEPNTDEPLTVSPVSVPTLVKLEAVIPLASVVPVISLADALPAGAVELITPLVIVIVLPSTLTPPSVPVLTVPTVAVGKVNEGIVDTAVST
jgi:hypothetical protein